MPSSSTATLVFGVLLVVGALLWIVGGRLSRGAAVTASLAAPNVTWTRAILESDERVDRATRIDMIERLAMVGERWCVAILNDAFAQERDATVHDAVERALLVIAARG